MRDTTSLTWANHGEQNEQREENATSKSRPRNIGWQRSTISRETIQVKTNMRKIARVRNYVHTERRKIDQNKTRHRRNHHSNRRKMEAEETGGSVAKVTTIRRPQWNETNMVIPEQVPNGGNVGPCCNKEKMGQNAMDYRKHSKDGENVRKNSPPKTKTTRDHTSTT